MRGLRQMMRLAEKVEGSSISLEYRPDDKYQQEWEATIEVSDKFGGEWRRSHVTGFGHTPVAALRDVERALNAEIVHVANERREQQAAVSPLDEGRDQTGSGW